MFYMPPTATKYMTNNQGHIASEKTKRVILIGTSHEYQTRHADSNLKEIEQFKNMLIEECSANAVRLIAEEMHEEALAENASKSVTQEVAIKLNIQHDFSEMSRKERAEAGVIPYIEVMAWQMKWSEQEKMLNGRKSHAIREKYWLNKLRLLDLWPALFICGADHTEFFRTLLCDNGIEVVIAFSDWAPT